MILNRNKYSNIPEQLTDEVYEYVYGEQPIAEKGLNGFTMFMKNISTNYYSQKAWGSLSDEQKSEWNGSAKKYRQGYITMTGNFTGKGKLHKLLTQVINDANEQGNIIRKALESNTIDEETSLEKIEDAVTSMIDHVIQEMQPTDEQKELLIERLDTNLRPILYTALGKAGMFKKELGETAPAIILQPGSRWVKPELYEKYSKPPPKEVFRGVVKDITKGRKKYYQAWRSFCIQTDELGKKELIQLAADMGLSPYIQIGHSKPRSWDKMTKKEICEFLQNYFAQTALSD